MVRLDPFYLISRVDALARLVPSGVRLVQLRLKDLAAAGTVWRI